MNLIQQAVERASQMDYRGKVVAPPLAPLAPLAPLSGFGDLHGRSFRPPALQPSRLPLAAAALALVALLGGAMLYVALVRTHAESGSATAPPAHMGASPATPARAATPAVAAVEVTAPAAVVAAAATAPAAPAPVAVARADTRPLDDAKATVEGWARAWSARDVTTYLGYYGAGFAPERGASRAAWEKARRQAIERRRSIAVSVNDLRLEQVADNRIVARYVQDYTADAYRESGTPKRLLLARESAGWRIVAEGADAGSAGSF